MALLEARPQGEPGAVGSTWPATSATCCAAGTLLLQLAVCLLVLQAARAFLLTCLAD